MKDPDINSELSEQRIAEILQRVSPRDKPSAEVSSSIKQNVRAAWQQEVALHPGVQRRNRWLAVAASVCLAVGAGFLFNTQTENISAASVAQVVGNIEYRASAQTDWTPVGKTTALETDAEVRTGIGSYAALTLTNGMTLRLDETTTIRLEGESQVYLSRGGLYAESDKKLTGQSLVVNTEFGAARDIGTEFEVRVSPDVWRVQVREGLVNVNADEFSTTAQAGERLVITRDQTVERETLSASDTSWQWTHRVHQPFAIEGASLSAYLVWWSDETGRHIVFKSHEDEIAATRTILHGSMNNLTVDDSLQVVLSTTDFEVVDSDSDQVILAR
jgi:ferric-dicitrate binding protein FerR (iron transport regulator)